MVLLPISPYITWKSISTNSAVPSHSRPDENASGPDFKARPINHWRKQLIPTTSSGGRNRRAGIGIPFDVPGGSVYLGNVTDNTTCLLNATDYTTGVKENIVKYRNVTGGPLTLTEKILSGHFNKIDETNSNDIR